MSLHTIIGAMSGTSMDGLDLSLCRYKESESGDYSYEIVKVATIPYPDDILRALEQSKTLPPEALFALDKTVGKFIGEQINTFIDASPCPKANIDAIASHGHTVFHQPEAGFTVQIGCGETIAFLTEIPVINDFRQKDVVAGGQGAPLVPMGDIHLFKGKAAAFLNLGGFANITLPGSPTLAFDICPANLPLNSIALQLGHRYDAEGNLARKGIIDENILAQLNGLAFYHREPPKSLGTEWLENEFMTLLETIPELHDQLRTAIAHIATQIGKICKKQEISSLYITGGGTYNTFLLEEIEKAGNCTIVLPSPAEIEFKEAIIFGFLGMRYLQGKTNVLSSVTGATKDVMGGVLHLP